MKKLIGIVGICAVVLLLGGWLSGREAGKERKDIDQGELIRFHVLANSDSEADQLLKRQVRDGILAKFSPVVGGAPSLEESRRIVKENLKAIEAEAARVIAVKGKKYPVKAEYGYFNFPAKSYGDLTLPAGRYEALRIVIGEGKGSNWWCVLFPPLCFVDITSSISHNPGINSTPLEQGTAAQEVKPIVKFKTIEVIKDALKK